MSIIGNGDRNASRSKAANHSDKPRLPLVQGESCFIGTYCVYEVSDSTSWKNWKWPGTAAWAFQTARCSAMIMTVVVAIFHDAL